MIRFDPFTADVDSVARQLLGAGAGPASQGRVPRFMPVDLFKEADAYVLMADLPGVDPASVDVDVDNGTLTITAERSARPEEAVQWLTSERFSGKFRRQVSLGEGIDSTRISASYENGVLTVNIPVAEKAKPRKITIDHGATGSDSIISGDTQTSTDTETPQPSVSS